jgi:hypothetical protein
MKRKFYFETEGVDSNSEPLSRLTGIKKMFIMLMMQWPLAPLIYRLGVVTPLPSPLLFSENGHVARRDWLSGGGGDSFSENEILIFRSRLSPLRNSAFTSLRFFIYDFLLLPTSVPIQSMNLVNTSQRFILHARIGPKGVSHHFHE